MLRRTKFIIAGYCIAGIVLIALALAMALQFTHWARHPEEFADLHHHHHEESAAPEATPAKTNTANGRTYLISPFVEQGFDVTQRSVDLAQVYDAGLNAKSFPALGELTFLSADKASLNEREGVLGIHIAGEEKAYSLRMLNIHIVLNDVCGGREIAVVWDALTLTPKVFDRHVVREDGSELLVSLAMLGLVHKGGLLLYDQETRSLWWPPEGRCIAGILNGKVLNDYPFLLVSWGVWKDRHPSTKILSPNAAFAMRYADDPYRSYFALPELPLPVEGWKEKGSPFRWNEPVIAFEVEGKAKAYPMSVLLAAKSDIEDTFGGRKIVIHSGSPPYPTDEKGNEIRYSFGAWFLWSMRYPNIEIYSPEKSGQQ
jgi:hypothetical protein